MSDRHDPARYESETQQKAVGYTIAMMIAAVAGATIHMPPRFLYEFIGAFQPLPYPLNGSWVVVTGLVVIALGYTVVYAGHGLAFLLYEVNRRVR